MPAAVHSGAALRRSVEAGGYRSADFSGTDACSDTGPDVLDHARSEHGVSHSIADIHADSAEWLANRGADDATGALCRKHAAP